jgi:hypothetical protein
MELFNHWNLAKRIYFVERERDSAWRGLAHTDSKNQLIKQGPQSFFSGDLPYFSDRNCSCRQLVAPIPACRYAAEKHSYAMKPKHYIQTPVTAFTLPNALIAQKRKCLSARATSFCSISTPFSPKGTSFFSEFPAGLFFYTNKQASKSARNAEFISRTKNINAESIENRMGRKQENMRMTTVQTKDEFSRLSCKSVRSESSRAITNQIIVFNFN